MSAIEDHLADELRGRIADHGVTGLTVTARPSEWEDWQIVVAAGARTFVAGFNIRDGLWLHETTPAHERNLVSNDQPRPSTSEQALAQAARLIAATVRNPTLPPRDPPVI